MYRTIPLLLFAAGCAKAVAPPSEQQFADWVTERYVAPFHNGDVEQWLQVFAEDAVGMHNTLPVMVGADNIRTFGNTVHENLTLDVYEVSVDEVRIAIPWAYTRGSYRTRFLPKNQQGEIPPPKIGKFVLLWERQRDGDWKVILDMGNQNTSCGFAECD